MLDKISITFHSAKGLEFEQVILFVSDYKLKTPQDIYNHYVACTRAKTKLVMVCFENEWADTHVFKLNRRTNIETNKRNSIYNYIVNNL